MRNAMLFEKMPEVRDLFLTGDLFVIDRGFSDAISFLLCILYFLEDNHWRQKCLPIWEKTSKLTLLRMRTCHDW